MREILFRGKVNECNNEEEFEYGEWVEGLITFVGRYNGVYSATILTDECDECQVDSQTVGQYTGLTDKDGRKIFEGDIVQYNTLDDFECQSVVKIGKYKQDGSDDEYKPTECYGIFVEVDNFTCPDWAENDPNCFPKYLMQQNLLEVASVCEIIGNIHDNADVLKNSENL